MSTFLGPPILDSIAASALVVDMQNTFVGHLTTRGYQLLAQVDGLGGYSDIIPPATETIGTSTFREVVRIYFPDNVTVKIGSYQACIADALPQSIRLTAKTGGAVQAGVTIGGVTVLGAVGGAGSTANDNLRALYYALKDSVDATITGWAYDYNSTDTLICTNKTVAAMVTCSGNVNVNYFDHAQSVLSGARSDFAIVDVNYGYGVTVDLTNGFVYYMDVFSRSFTLSTKCLSGVYGPIFASYMDHTEALTVTPATGPCTPMELWVGECSDGLGQAFAKPTHWWGIGTRYFRWTVTNTQATTIKGAFDNGDAHPFTGAIGTNQISDLGLSHCIGTGNSYPEVVTFGEMGAFETGSTANKILTSYKLASVAATQEANYRDAPWSYTYRFMAGGNLPDIYKWHGAEPNETAAMGQLQPGLSNYPTLAQALDTTTAYTTITLSSTASIPPAGGLIIGTEEITYTGVSGATITGVSMAQNGTARARHFVGDVAYPVTWFLKINGGAICCGPDKPV